MNFSIQKHFFFKLLHNLQNYNIVQFHIEDQDTIVYTIQLRNFRH